MRLAQIFHNGFLHEALEATSRIRRDHVDRCLKPVVFLQFQRLRKVSFHIRTEGSGIITLFDNMDMKFCKENVDEITEKVIFNSRKTVRSFTKIVTNR